MVLGSTVKSLWPALQVNLPFHKKENDSCSSPCCFGTISWVRSWRAQRGALLLPAAGSPQETWRCWQLLLAEASAKLVAVLLGLSPLPAAGASTVSRPSGAPARCVRDCLLPVLLEMSGLSSGQEKIQRNPQML